MYPPVAGTGIQTARVVTAIRAVKTAIRLICKAIFFDPIRIYIISNKIYFKLALK
jgi:hypothetical protein